VERTGLLKAGRASIFGQAHSLEYVLDPPIQRFTVDVDGVAGFEASACTNMLPIHRMSFPVGEVVHAAAVNVRALDLSVTQLEQTYRRIDAHRFAYTAEPDFAAVLEYDAAGLIVDYPGVARRSA